MPKSKRTSYFPHISIIGKVLNCMAIIQIYFFCVFIDTNNKSTQKNRLSETTHLGAQNQMYKQVDSDFFKNITMFFKILTSNIACCSNAANLYTRRTAHRQCCTLTPHSTGRRSRYAHGDLGFSLKLSQIAAEA